jgi:TonB family protein
MSKNSRFLRNVILIALAHVALIAGLIRWSQAARSAPDAESLVWLSGAEDLALERSESAVEAPTKISVESVEPEPLRRDEQEKEQAPATQAKSEIDVPMATPSPKPAEKPKATPKPTPKSTPKKMILAKASKTSAHAKPIPAKPSEKPTDANSERKKSTKTVSAKPESSPATSAAKTGSSKGGIGGGGDNASEFGWYGNMLHDRFYSAWIQPTTNIPSGARISTLVKIRIEKDGRVSKFEIIKPSGNVIVNESVATVAKQVTQVDAPPTGLIKGDHYDVKINFELNTNQETAR